MPKQFGGVADEDDEGMPAQSSDRNAFLADLTASDFELLRPHLAAINLGTSERLHHGGAAIDQSVFPHSGVVAVMIPLRNGGGGGARPQQALRSFESV